VRHIGFTRPLQIGKGQHGTVVHHEVVEMPIANAQALRAAHPDAVVDLTPLDFGFEVTVARRASTLRVIGCPSCKGQKRMTVCPACDNAGKVMVV
jgi:hypothetical protein